METAYALANAYSEKLSEQQFVSCSQDFGTYGCNGGEPWLAWDYAELNPIAYANDYPYVDSTRTSGASACNPNLPLYPSLLAVNKTLISGTNSAMGSALTQGLIAVAIDTTSTYFRTYAGGVLLQNMCGVTMVNYSAVITGEDDP